MVGAASHNEAGRAVTLTDVANRAGVSQPTASRVLNGSARKPAPGIVERVRQAADELGYTPNAQAQALGRSSTGLLGLVYDIADPYFSAVASGVHRATSDRNRQMLLAVSSRVRTGSCPASRRSSLTARRRSSWSGPGRTPPRRRGPPTGWPG